MRLTMSRFQRVCVYITMGVLGVISPACQTPPLEVPYQVDPTPQCGYDNRGDRLRNKVDILFMVDNSNSMEGMAAELRNRFGDFLTPFRELADKGTFVDMHIGVVTSDYGAGATGAPGCNPSPGGQQGRLQAIGQKAAPGCKKPIGSNYIQYEFDSGGGTRVSNLPMDQSLAETFACMASVGASGCGFEHQLESVYAALHNNLPENQGFLRDDALLVVVFLTNEDDASAPPDSDIFDKSKTAQYGYEDSYSRQTRFAVMCEVNGALSFPPYGDSGGVLTGCVPAPNNPPGAGPGKQYDVQRYIDFFSKVPSQGGLKESPLDIVLIGIDAPDDPFAVILSNPGTQAGQSYQPCGLLEEASNPPCVPVLQHSCINQQQPAFFGDPAVRLNTVIRSVKNHTIASICGDDANRSVSYANVMKTVASQILLAFNGDCLVNKLPGHTGVGTCATSTDCAAGEGCNRGGQCVKIDCLVTDLTENPDGTVSENPIQQCPRNGVNPGMAACWRLDPKPACADTQQFPDGLGLTIDRAGLPAPDHTHASSCCSYAN